MNVATVYLSVKHTVPNQVARETHFCEYTVGPRDTKRQQVIRGSIESMFKYTHIVTNMKGEKAEILIQIFRV